MNICHVLMLSAFVCLFSDFVFERPFIDRLYLYLYPRSLLLYIRCTCDVLFESSEL